MTLSELAAGGAMGGAVVRSAAPIDGGRLKALEESQLDVQLAKKSRPGFVEDAPSMIFEPLRQGFAAQVALAAGAQQAAGDETARGAAGFQDAASQALQARRAYGADAGPIGDPSAALSAATESGSIQDSSIQGDSTEDGSFQFASGETDAEAGAVEAVSPDGGEVDAVDATPGGASVSPADADAPTTLIGDGAASGDDADDALIPGASASETGTDGRTDDGAVAPGASEPASLFPASSKSTGGEQEGGDALADDAAVAAADDEAFAASGAANVQPLGTQLDLAA